MDPFQREPIGIALYLSKWLVKFGIVDLLCYLTHPGTVWINTVDSATLFETSMHSIYVQHV